jgi:putative transposase
VFVERLWRTVKYEEVYLKDYETPREAAQQLGQFFVRYNEQRQHQALGYQTPATVYLAAEWHAAVYLNARSFLS